MNKIITEVISKIRPLIVVVLIHILYISQNLYAYDFIAGGLYYNITSDTTVEVTTWNNKYETPDSYIGDIIIPETVEYKNTEYLVTRIGVRAFSSSDIKSLFLPESISSFGEDAFFGCTSLKSINIPEGISEIPLYSFYLCTSLQTIKIPENVKKIGFAAFANCQSLTNVYLPSKVAEIGNGAFSDCSALESITLSDENEYFSTLNGVLYSKDMTTLLQCPANYKEKTFKLLGNVKIIAGSAFRGCTHLTEIYLSEGLESMGSSAFSGCESLTTINLPMSLKKIGSYAFYNCFSLKTIEIPPGIETLDMFLFANCSKLEEVVLSEGLQLIDYQAFQNCYSIKSISLPSSLKFIDAGAFRGCKSLSKINIQEGLTGIGYSAFSECHSLPSIVLPESIEEIGYQAFDKCGLLKEIICKALNVPQIYYSFSGISKNAILYVYNSVIEDYQKSIWSSFFKQILPIMEDVNTGIETIVVDDRLPFDIYNLNGMIVRRNAVKTDISGLNPGVYILKQGDASQRIMIR